MALAISSLRPEKALIRITKVTEINPAEEIFRQDGYCIVDAETTAKTSTIVSGSIGTCALSQGVFFLRKMDGLLLLFCT